MSGACDCFVMEDLLFDEFELDEYIESFDMSIMFLLGPPTPSEVIFIPSVDSDGWLTWTNNGGLPNPAPVNIKGPPGGGGGTSDYADLTNKPSINGVTLVGNKTTAELLISLTKADVGLGNVDNVRQYSANNPPPYPVTSVNGMTGDVVVQGGGGTSDYSDLTNKPSINGVTLVGNKTTAELLISLTKADVGLGNVDNVRQYSADNPPPYPVTSVNGATGAVVLSFYDANNPPPYPVTSVNGATGAVVLSFYDANNPPPYPVTSVAGKTGAISLLPSDVGLGNVDNVRQYSANNPPPYPVMSVNGMTGDVVVQGGSGATEVLGVAAAFAIPAAGSSVSYDMTGLTANYQLVLWNFSASAENDPPADLEWTTYAGYFTITNNGGTTSETIKPVFALPTAVAITAH